MRKDRFVWYLSNNLKSWELLSISLIASYLVESGYDLTIVSEDGIYPGTDGNIVSWNSLGWGQKLKRILFSGNVWHLWGEAPSWWGIIKTRATTVHSFKAKGPWQGHPLIIGNDGGTVDRNTLIPPFSKFLSWGVPGETNREPALFFLSDFISDEIMNERLSFIRESNKYPIFKVSNKPSSSSENDVSIEEKEALKMLCKRGGVVVLGEVSRSLAIFSCFAAMYGVPTLAPWSSLLDQLLGVEGYISFDEKSINSDFWENAIGDMGRRTATRARHRLEEFFSPEISSENLIKVYNTLRGVSI